MIAAPVPPAPAWLPSLTSLWRSVGPVTLATVITFGLSVMVNALVFDAWGQTFLALATPADVLMSGLGLGLIPGMMAAAYFGARILVSTRRSEPRAWWALWWTLVTWCLVAAKIVGYGPPAALLWWVVMMPAWVVGSLVSLADWRDQDGGGHDGVLRSIALMTRAGLRGLASLALVLVLLAFSSGMIWAHSHVGYFAWPLRLADSDTPPNCEGRVLWSGERAMLIDCGAPSARDVQVLYKLEGVRLIRDMRHRPNPPPPPIVIDAEQWLDQLAASMAASR